MNVCCSIAPVTMTDAFKKLGQAGKIAGLVELRIDGIRDCRLDQLLQQPRPRVIITNRRKNEGGKFEGTVREHVSLLSEAIRLGAEYIDIEMSCGTRAVQQIVERSGNSKVIVSYHNFDKTHNDLTKRYERMKATGADIVKIAAMANDITDNATMFQLLKKSRSDRQPLIAICMGERGQISRILQGKYGGYLTYAPLDSAVPTAPGQYSYTDLINTFRVPILRSGTKIFGLIGNPVSFSKGIYFHNSLFSAKRLNAVYVNFLVDRLASFMETYRGIAQGFSVTMPYKQEILPYIDRIDPGVQELRTVNTIIRSGNILFGTNTDLLGFLACMKKRISLHGKNVTILGTGGTARTMAFGAILKKARVTIIGRDADKTKRLADELGCTFSNPSNLREIDTDVLINATSAGMNSATEIPFNADTILRKQMIVFDAVYSPPVTPFLRKAEERGCTTISGLELFQTQAKLQSKLFINSI